MAGGSQKLRTQTAIGRQWGNGQTRRENVGKIEGSPQLQKPHETLNLGDSAIIFDLINHDFDTSVKLAEEVGSPRLNLIFDHQRDEGLQFCNNTGGGGALEEPAKEVHEEGSMLLVGNLKTVP